MSSSEEKKRRRSRKEKAGAGASEDGEGKVRRSSGSSGPGPGAKGEGGGTVGTKGRARAGAKPASESPDRRGGTGKRTGSGASGRRAGDVEQGGGGDGKRRGAASKRKSPAAEHARGQNPEIFPRDEDEGAPPVEHSHEADIDEEGRPFDRGAWADDLDEIDYGHADPLDEFFVGPDEKELMGPAGLAAALTSDEDGEEQDSSVDDDYLSFMLGDEEYAVPITALREIVRPLPITEVPRTAPYVLGVITLRGAVLPVLDLRIRLGLPTGERARGARILVIETDEGPAGVWADRVAEVVRIGGEPLEPPPGALGSGAELLDGIIRRDGRMLIVLNLGAALRVDACESARKKA